MIRKVLIAVATEMDGHAFADAITTKVDFHSKEAIKQMLIERLSEGDNKSVIRRINRHDDIWEVYGYFGDEDYPFSAVVALATYSHIQSATG